ncbi:uncharacterized protein LOC113306444 [Papaver somniferum]|uniref:uncharacterized protein LOC113306444 n=1 Tax=Papaver somniferum TaxID=3469 RepID=UPI000E6FB272|nr:uncharacterized protein LOC113306444 [Papaver somniferum]
MRCNHTIGHSNGLVCYLRGKDLFTYTPSSPWTYFSLEICNPSRLEKLIIASRIQVHYDICGFQFGYNILNSEYKVMCIANYKDEYEYLIYTVGSTQPWRKIKNPWLKHRPIYDVLSGEWACRPISCNGTLFYCMIKEENVEEKTRVLVSFDLTDEQFQEIKPPSEEFVGYLDEGDFYHLEYKGCFCCAIMKQFDPFNGKVDLHILKDAIKHVWFRETVNFNISSEFGSTTIIAGCRNIMCFSDQVILDWRLRNEQNNHVMLLYNVLTKEFFKNLSNGVDYR